LKTKEDEERFNGVEEGEMCQKRARVRANRRASTEERDVSLAEHEREFRWRTKGAQKKGKTSARDRRKPLYHSYKGSLKKKEPAELKRPEERCRHAYRERRVFKKNYHLKPGSFIYVPRGGGKGLTGGKASPESSIFFAGIHLKRSCPEGTSRITPRGIKKKFGKSGVDTRQKLCGGTGGSFQKKATRTINMTGKGKKEPTTRKDHSQRKLLSLKGGKGSEKRKKKGNDLLNLGNQTLSKKYLGRGGDLKRGRPIRRGSSVESHSGEAPDGKGGGVQDFIPYIPKFVKKGRKHPDGGSPVSFRGKGKSNRKGRKASIESESPTNIQRRGTPRRS